MWGERDTRRNQSARSVSVRRDPPVSPPGLGGSIPCGTAALLPFSTKICIQDRKRSYRASSQAVMHPVRNRSTKGRREASCRCMECHGTRYVCSGSSRIGSLFDRFIAPLPCAESPFRPAPERSADALSAQAGKPKEHYKHGIPTLSLWLRRSRSPSLLGVSPRRSSEAAVTPIASPPPCPPPRRSPVQGGSRTG